MRLVHAFLPLVTLLIGCDSVLGHRYAPAQTPFRDDRFHLIFTAPAPLRGIPGGDLRARPDHPNPNEIPLFAAREPGTTYGIMLIAEKMHVPTAHSPQGFTNADDFLRMIPSANTDTPGFSAGSIRHTTGSSGFTVSELDYRIGAEYDAGLAFPVQAKDGDYLIIFRCTAASQADLEKMTAAVDATRRTQP